jgi:hypothetical protein
MEMSFDQFVGGNATSSTTYSELPRSTGRNPTQYFQHELFNRRNRIVHWGYVNSNHAEAELCHKVAVALVSILREMDRSKYGNL